MKSRRARENAPPTARGVDRSWKKKIFDVVTFVLLESGDAAKI